MLRVVKSYENCLSKGCFHGLTAMIFYDEAGNTVYVVKASFPGDINLQFMTLMEMK